MRRKWGRSMTFDQSCHVLLYLCGAGSFFVCFGVYAYSGSFQTVIYLQSRCKLRLAAQTLHL